MDIIVIVVEHIVAIRMAMDEVDRLLAGIPRLLAELHTTRRGKSGNLVLHVGHAVAPPTSSS